MGSPLVSMRVVVLFLFLLEAGSLVTGGLAVEAVLEVDELATEGLLARPVVSSSSESDDPTKAKGGGGIC